MSSGGKLDDVYNDVESAYVLRERFETRADLRLRANDLKPVK